MKGQPHITAVILAAGMSSRMEAANKLLLPIGGTPVVARIVEAVQAAPVEEVIVVTGHERAAVEKVLARYPVRVVHNADYASGMASSIRRGVEAVSPATGGIMIGLGDLPLIQSVTLRQLCERFAAAPSPVIVMPIYEGRRGHPVVFDAGFREELLELQGDVGARSVIRTHESSVVELEVNDPGVARDVDTRAAYGKLVRAVKREGGVTDAGCGPQ